MSKFNPGEEKFLERQKQLNTIHRHMMLKCNGDDSACTIGPPEERMSYDRWKTQAPDLDGPEEPSTEQQRADYEDEMQGARPIDNVGNTAPTSDIRWAVNVLLEKIAERFEAHETLDLWRSDAAAIIRSFKHDLIAPLVEAKSEVVG